jgi:hypothetical protein
VQLQNQPRSCSLVVEAAALSRGSNQTTIPFAKSLEHTDDYRMSNKAKRDTPMVHAVLALQEHLNELERIGTKINAADLTGELDADHIQKLLVRFAECGQGISDEITNFSVHLQEARAHAEVVAQGVSSQAEIFRTRREEQNAKMDQFNQLGERVQQLNASISRFKDPENQNSGGFGEYADQLAAIIKDLHELRDSARDSRMKSLEKKAQSLAQSLEAAHAKLRDAIQSQS